MRRRDFLGTLGGAAAWPAAARGQPSERTRLVAILVDAPEDARSRPRIRALVQGLADLGWSERRNLRIDIRWGANTPANSRRLADELLKSNPDVVVTSGSPATAALQELAGNIPIVFALVTDPVGAGLVDSLARPGGNVTGFTLFEYSIAAKWLELLNEIAPDIRRVAILRDTRLAAGSGQFGAIQSASSGLGVELRPLDVTSVAEIERGLAAFAPRPGDGMIVTATPLAAVYREQIISLVTKHRMPSTFAYRHFVTAGGLISYGPDLVGPFHRVASYVSRILSGDKPGDLPVQAPTAYELVVNLRTAAALGLTVPPTLLARADEVVE